MPLTGTATAGAPAHTWLTDQRLIMAVFFLQPVAFGSWLPRIPDVQRALGLGPAGLALALLGLPVGILLWRRMESLKARRS